MKLKLPKTRRYRVYIYIASALMVALAIDQIWVRAWRHIDVSEATTRITSPLRPDGMPDFIQHLDDQQRRGVTAENNAYIPFIEMFPPAGLQPAETNAIYEKLGLTPPTTRQQLKLLAPEDVEKETLTRSKPWSREEHPELVAWMDANGWVFRMVPEVVNRPRWYVPTVTSGNDLAFAIITPSLGAVREVGTLLLTRAMLEIHEEKFAEAREHIMSAHRLARLVGQGNTLISSLVGISLDHWALEGDRALVAADGLPRKELRAFIAEWHALPAFSTIVPNLETERFGTLSTLIFWSAHMNQRSSLLVDGYQEEPGWWEPVWRQMRPAHFNAALREVNDLCDQIGTAARLPTAPEREAALKRADRVIDAYSTRYGGKWSDPARRLAARLLPQLGGAMILSDVRDEVRRMVRVELALTAYKADKNAYPEALDALKPQYLADLPSDGFSGAPYKYRRTEKGYVLYSVGVNLTDDGGVTDKRNLYRAGDLVVQVP